MLRGAVQEIEPSDAALDHLRHAVPARRARKRQVVVGVAAAALFIGTAVPALVHVTNSSGSTHDPSTAVGHSSEVPGGSAAEVAGGSDYRDRTPPGRDDDGGRSKGDTKETESPAPGEPSSSASAGPDPSASSAMTAAVCDAGQLGQETANAQAPNQEGKVYGAFRIANVSGTECTVGEAGSVVFAAKGAANPDKIEVTEHTPGDGASELPDPPAEPTSLLLKPGEAYVVRFAWVPSESCPSPGASPDPTPTGDGASGGTAQDPGMEPQLGTEEGSQDGSVTITYTAASGAPSTSTTIPDACAGTIYRTGILAAS